MNSNVKNFVASLTNAVPVLKIKIIEMEQGNYAMSINGRLFTLFAHNGIVFYELSNLFNYLKTLQNINLKAILNSNGIQIYKEDALIYEQKN